MDNVKYQLRLQGLRTPDGAIAARVLVELLGRIIECAERSLRFAIEGVSVKSGPTPLWLADAVNLSLTAIESGRTIIYLEARPLAAVIGSEIQQPDFWMTAPAPSDTALSLFARSVRDATAEVLESDYYDAGVLRGLLGLKSLLKNEVTSIELVAEGRPDEGVTLTMNEMEKAERLKIRTPDPQPCVVAGELDAIQHGRKRFQLRRANGQLIPGSIHEEFISAERLREFWGKQVTVKGTLHFKASGKIQLLQAHSIAARAIGDEPMEQMPLVQTEAEFVAASLSPLAPGERNG
jgi:hypothetical protein